MRKYASDFGGMMDRLRAMEMFLSVAKTGSFTETARLSATSATSVSRIISDLEDYLGVQLLLRSTRQVALTEAGDSYVSQIEPILWSIEEVRNGISAISTKPQGVLRIHSRTMFGLGVLTPMMPQFAALYPDIRVELALGEEKVDLRRQGIDIDFRISPPAEAGLKRRKLFESQRLLVASAAYLAKRPPVRSPSDLLGHDLLVYLRPGDAYYWRFKGNDGDLDLEIAPRHVSNNGMVLLDLALSGLGIALLDDYTVAHWLTKGDLVQLLSDHSVTNSTFEEGIYATFLDTPLVPAKIRTMLDFVIERTSGRQRRFDVWRPPLTASRP